LVTRTRLALKSDALGSLDVWEISRYVSELTVKELMLKRREIQVVTPQRTIERAARLMADFKVGCLPVVEDHDVVVGILTEVDVMRAFQEMMGLPTPGVRVTMRMPNRSGEFNKLMSVVAEKGWGVMGVGSFPTPRREDSYDLVLKLPDLSKEEVETTLSAVPDQVIVDIRTIS
jgi:acetoin utilization protein AcuB